MNKDLVTERFDSMNASTVVNSLLCLLCLLMERALIRAEGSSYCATFSSDYDSSTTTGGVTGSFYMLIDSDENMGSYRFYLDLSEFSSTCDISQGLNYHVHSNWVNSSTTSDLGSVFCGPAYTGYHYDPTMACSSTSENQGTTTGYNSDNCQKIGRYATASPAYTYGCSTTVYGQGDYSQCELGDLSGKMGMAFPSSGRIFDQSQTLEDVIPVYSYNYMQDSLSSSPHTAFSWASIVFHCKSGGTRLFCAKFEDVSSSSSSDESSSCGKKPSSSDSGDDNDDRNEKEVIGLIVGRYVLPFDAYRSPIMPMFMFSLIMLQLTTTHLCYLCHHARCDCGSDWTLSITRLLEIHPGFVGLQAVTETTGGGGK